VCEDEEGHSAGEEEGEEQRWAEEVARDREGASGGTGCPAALPPSPLDADARALHKVLLRLGLEGYFATLRAEALASLSLLQDLATSDADALRKVLREAGIGRVGHREALVLALTRGGKGAAAAPPGQGGAAAAGGGGGGGLQQGEPQQGGAKLLGVRNEGLRAALGRLSVFANEAGGELPLLGVKGGGGALSAAVANGAPLAPLV